MTTTTQLCRLCRESGHRMEDCRFSVRARSAHMDDLIAKFAAAVQAWEHRSREDQEYGPASRLGMLAQFIAGTAADIAWAEAAERRAAG